MSNYNNDLVIEQANKIIELERRLAASSQLVKDLTEDLDARVEETHRLRADMLEAKLNADRYLEMRSNPNFDIRIIGVGKRSGKELDYVVDRTLMPMP